MSNSGLTIEVKRSGFPVVIGGVEFFFDMSDESLTKFFTTVDLLKEKEAEKKEKLEHLPETVEAYSEEDFQLVLALRKETLIFGFDRLFEEGAFEKLYAKIPDLTALEEAFLAVSEGIEKKMNEQIEERNKNILNRKKKIALDKKKRKQ